MPLALSIALAHLIGRRRQTVVSVFGVGLGVAFFIGLSSLMLGFQRDFIARIIDTSPHVLIRDEYRTPRIQPAVMQWPDQPVVVHGLKPRDEVRGIRTAREILAALADLPDVVAAPVLAGPVFLRYGSADRSATLTGISPVVERRVTTLERDLLSGSLDSLSTTANGIILGELLAQRLGVGVGGTITATSAAGVVMRMTVVAVFRSGITTLDASNAYALTKRVQVLLNRPEVINLIRLRLADAEQARSVAAVLERRFAYKAESWEETNSNVLTVFVIQRAIIFSTVGAILIVACFGIFNVISTVIHEKARDIAILKSMGFRESDVRHIFLIEGLMLGMIGVAIGWGLGFLLVELLGSIRFNNEGFIRAQGFVLFRSWIHYGIGGAVAMVASILAAWLPARKAARVNPVDIVRGAA
ncbi:MAG: ABC transporter permease [Alphaproteobacteria bacterium]|nr:MAG: ABC transporter permease [Alphaproteobacteria bacterium]